uniref:ATP synthase F0 subunit 8 n=1 Tax=Araneus ventricosus TaxID=182803 RepID=A0A0U1XJG8_ARAVE|nr:ATP synthase F0 subunit 8 [Araneus ventricosus]AIU45749.1 ATP synthase F0 subunit 8 [Araneus ventricosus]
MPQLMPLNWIFSSMMVFMLVVCGSIIYSEVMVMSKVQYSVLKADSSLNNWCW